MPEDGPENQAESVLGMRLSRRRMLQATGVATGALAMGGLGRASAAAAATGAAGRTGTIKDLKHIVVYMQENRSFDHYFGTLAVPGAAGFGDKQAVQFGNGQNIFFQPDTNRSDGFLLPYRLDTTTFNGQFATPSMGYFESEDLPFHHALARAYTVGDHYHCSLVAATEPNRVMLWSGTNDPDGDNGGPVNSDGFPLYGFTWETYCEVLQDAGVSWQIYVNTAGEGQWLRVADAFTIDEFAAFNPANANAENTVPGQGLLARAGGILNSGAAAPPGVTNDPSDLDFVLRDFIADCASGQLPEISWIVSPHNYNEHPGDAPDWGALYINRVLEAMHSNLDVWNSTLLLIDYDENNVSFFDHVVRPVPEAGTTGESTPGLIPGLGARVPLFVISPWTRGGWVAKETFDHTSTIQLMEAFTTSLGKPAICTKISPWRRSICGDLTSAIDFTSFDNSFPALPDPNALLAVVAKDQTLPAPPEPAPGQQTFPVQSVQGSPKIRPAPYQQHAIIQVDRSAGRVTAIMSNTSAKAASMLVFPDSLLATPFAFGLNTQAAAVPNTVSKASGPKTYTVDTTTTGGSYNFAIYGPDHFVRAFTGTVIPDGDSGGQVPQVDASLGTGQTKTLRITLTNWGRTPVSYTLTPNDYEGEKQTVTVGFGKHVMIDWPTSSYGYYDVTVTANTIDTFVQRYAGRIS